MSTFLFKHLDTECARCYNGYKVSLERVDEMKKVIIIGCPGSGKSTFARALAEKVGLPLYHLDNMYWNADRTHVERPVFLERLQAAMSEDAWIIDGNYNSTMEMRMAACDTVFFLDYPVEVCMAGAEERKGTKRTDIPWVESRDDRDEEFINFIKAFREESRPRILSLFRQYSDKEIHVFTSRSEATDYLTTVNLPKRLTISFPLWLTYGTEGEYSPYLDIDKAMREHKERGFNCVRIDSGVGLIHGQDGNRLPLFRMDNIFGEYERIPRQQRMLGDGGEVDLFGRLITVLECARKYGMCVILSSWYYLHTYWFHGKGDPICDSLFAIPPEDRLMAFARMWDYLLKEIEARGLSDRIAFVEIFNEVNDHPYMCGVNKWGPERGIGAEGDAFYKKKHEEAIAFLQERHPYLMIAYDTDFPRMEDPTLPENAQVYNFHSYFMWSIYGEVIEEHPEWFRGEIKPEDVMKAREGRRPAAPDWYDRVALYNDMREDVIPQVEAALEEYFTANSDKFLRRMENMLRNAVESADGRPVVCGEGVTYICSKLILWEEKSEGYWELVKNTLARYKEAGLWGTVIRTCMGPEDPSWELCKDKITELNKFFLE